MSTSSQSSNEDILTYPKSFASATSEGPVLRSRIWSEDITKTWNVPISGLESVEERVQRYKIYFTLTTEQMRVIFDRIRSEMSLGLELHKQNPKEAWEPSKCSLKMLDTWITEEAVPRGNEKGSAFALDFAGSDVSRIRAVKVDMEGQGKMKISEVSLGLRDVSLEYPKGLLDRNATALKLFDSFAGIIKSLKEQKGSPVKEDETIPVGFSVCFPVDQRGFETGRCSDDPVEGMDLAALLDCAFWRNDLNARTKAILNDNTGVLLTCCYERPENLPPCKVGFILGGGVNGCYIQPEAKRTFGYKGCIVNCELGGFDKSLPVNDVDLEVDFADDTTKGVQPFEKMVSTTYLGEICRRLVVKIWQTEAPQLAWVRYSMPWLACARVIADQDSDLSTTGEILNGLWEWSTSVEQRRVVQQLFGVVFDRSAALAAVAIVALASQTQRLQPAFGGITCAIGGNLCTKVPSYYAKLRSFLDIVLDNDTARLIHLYPVENGSAKGAGFLAST